MESSLREQFIPYKLALKLKQLGFIEPCVGYFSQLASQSSGWDIVEPDEPFTKWYRKGMVLLPLWQQAFDWFRSKYNLFGTIVISGQDDWQYYVHDLNARSLIYSGHIRFSYENQHTIYEDTRLALLNKLIELLNK